MEGGERIMSQAKSYDIVYDDVSKVYNHESTTEETVVALENVNETLPGDKFISIVGPSGCGKSTLLNITQGLTEPTDGMVKVGGEEIKSPRKEENLDRAVVFQDSTLLPWKTVLENVTYGLDIRGIEEIEGKPTREHAKEFIQMVGLAGFEEAYPHQLSGGMQQRVNLARALVLQPGLLLMDEPFSSLDAQTKEVMQTELLDLWKKNRSTVLFVTHDLEEAVFLSDEVLVLGTDPGRVIDRITIDIDRPRKRSVRGTAKFGELTDRMWNLLEEEVKKTLQTG